MIHSGNSRRIQSDRIAALAWRPVSALRCWWAQLPLITPTPASAKVEFAGQTGLPCGQCHTNPAGSGRSKPAEVQGQWLQGEEVAQLSVSQ
jgi:hypothetical protein